MRRVVVGVVVCLALSGCVKPPLKARTERIELLAEWQAYDAAKALYLACLMADYHGFDGDPAPCLDEHGNPVRMPERPSKPRPA